MVIISNALYESYDMIKVICFGPYRMGIYDLVNDIGSFYTVI